MPKTKPFKDLARAIDADPKRRARVEREKIKVLAEILSYQLDELRQSRNVTQSELADSLGIHQPNVSRLESGQDPKLSTLRAYVAALGGHLELVAVFDDEYIKLSV
jgi:DNA-binding XRE family transcriptional regulator